MKNDDDTFPLLCKTCNWETAADVYNGKPVCYSCMAKPGFGRRIPKPKYSSSRGPVTTPADLYWDRVFSVLAALLLAFVLFFRVTLLLPFGDSSTRGPPTLHYSSLSLSLIDSAPNAITGASIFFVAFLSSFNRTRCFFPLSVRITLYCIRISPCCRPPQEDNQGHCAMDWATAPRNAAVRQILQQYMHAEGQ